MVALAIVVYFGQDFLQTVASGEEVELSLPELRDALLIYLGIGLVLFLVAAGVFASWYFTRFVIDESELRIDTGMLFRQSKRIPFTKVQSVDVVQPALARIVGLAELNIDAGPESSTRLRYLKRDDAYRFRDYLLIRAHGQQTTVAATQVTGKVFEDIGDSDEVLVRIGPAALLIAALLGTETLVMVAFLLVAIISLTVFGLPWIGLATIIPFAFGLVSHLNKAMFSQFNYTLARSGPGLKITRGLTSLTSQAVPRSRIQGVRITQSLLWRPFGLYRIDMELLGTASIDSDGQQAAQSPILVPAGTAAEVRTALAALWPGIDTEAVLLLPAPKQARWLRPITAATLRHGASHEIAVVARGRFNRVRRIVPLARLQSVGIQQGPLQRALRLADVHLHTAGHVLGTRAMHLDPAEARRFALELIESARAAGAPALLADTPAPSRPALGWPRPAGAPAAGLGFPAHR